MQCPKCGSDKIKSNKCMEHKGHTAAHGVSHNAMHGHPVAA